MALSVISYQDTAGITARSDRQLITASSANRSGIINSSNFQLSVSTSATLIHIATGYAMVKSATADQGSYFVYHDGNNTINLTPNGTSFPRIDTIYLNVRDTNVDGSGFTDARILSSTGTAFPSANLANLSGVILPSSGNNLILGFVVVPASGANIASIGGYIDPSTTSRGAVNSAPPQYAYGRPADTMPAAAISTSQLQAVTSGTTCLFDSGFLVFQTITGMGDFANNILRIKSPGVYQFSWFCSLPGTPSGEGRNYLVLNGATTFALQSWSSADFSSWWCSGGTIRCGYNDSISLVFGGGASPTLGSRGMQAAWVAP